MVKTVPVKMCEAFCRVSASLRSAVSEKSEIKRNLFRRNSDTVHAGPSTNSRS